MHAMTTMLSQSEMSQGLMLTLVGMGVVFVSLIILMLLVGALTWVSGRLDREVQAKPGTRPVPASPADPAPARVDSSPVAGEELIVVLAAAAAAALGRPIGAIRLLRYQRESDHWQVQGRHSLASKHQPPSHSPRKLRS